MKTLPTKILSVITFSFLTLSSFAFANPSEHQHGHHHEHSEAFEQPKSAAVEGASCSNIIDVQVNGLVCDFCARALEKVVGKRKEVQGIDVDLNNGKVSVALNEGKNLDDATLTKLITDSGYNVVNIKKGC